MAKQDFRKHRYVWSPKHGGCIMFQTRYDLEWKDSDSTEEGMYPKHNQSAKESVKWYNLQLRVENCRYRMSDLQHKILLQSIKVQKLQERQEKISKKIQALIAKGK